MAIEKHLHVSLQGSKLSFVAGRPCILRSSVRHSAGYVHLSAAETYDKEGVPGTAVGSQVTEPGNEIKPGLTCKKLSVVVLKQFGLDTRSLSGSEMPDCPLVSLEG